MKNLKSPSFKNDQYFILDKKRFAHSLSHIEKAVNEDYGINEPYEKVWIPEKQINGQIKKIGQSTFDIVNEHFLNDLKHIIEKETCLIDLELLAVRRNVLHKNDYVSMHKDSEGYIVLVDLPIPVLPDEDTEDNNDRSNEAKSFEGGNILFTKDDGEIIEIELQPDELLVAKCTNKHGVKKILSGTRESIALFSAPKS
jgi:hypothetical protein